MSSAAPHIHHFLLPVYFCFLLGGMLHVFQRASTSNLGLTPSLSTSLFLEKYWNIIFIRLVIALLLFTFWVEHPQWVDTLIDKYSPGTSLDVSLPPTKLIGCCVGYMSDSILNFVSQKAPAWIRSEIPAIPSDTPIDKTE